MPAVNPPRGMRDFLPADKARREQVLGIIRAGYLARGFDEIETPVMEEASRLSSGLGGDNEKLAFWILRRGLDQAALAAAADSDDATGLVDLGLRFDLTVPLARYYATNRAQLPTPFKSIQIGPVWRAERPQKGRYRQFVQCDIDVIGEAGTIAETELITATAATLTALGLTDVRIRINHRHILYGLLKHWGVPADGTERALITIDKEDKSGAAGVAAELVEQGLLGASRQEDAVRDLAGLPGEGWVDDADAPAWLDLEAYGQLREIRQAVSAATAAMAAAASPVTSTAASSAVAAATAPTALATTATTPPAGTGIPLVFSANLVRGMGYYTGAIFEIEHPEFGYSLGGGGRYDGMIGRFSGQDVPAVGFSIGFERVVDLVSDTVTSSGGAVVLLHDVAVSPAELLSLQAALIAEGHRVRLEPRAKNTKAQLERALAAGYTSFAQVDSTTTREILQLRPLS